MSQKGDYPSPSGMQGHNNSGPYPGHQDNQNDDLDLQLRHAITNNGAGVGVEHATVPVARDNNNAYTAPLFTPGPPAGYQQVNMASHPLMAAQMHQPQRGQPTSDANKKKSKASRACDECRRKKIKCDADSETGDGQACSNCRRINGDNAEAKCKFSRTPMKRGPSKGYIKELSDRVATLEQGRTPPDSDTMASGRKRTHSMSEGLMPDHFGTPTPNSTERWPTTFPAGHQSLAPMASMSGNGNNLPITTESEGSINMGPLTQEELSDLKLYNEIVHPTLPLLPSGTGGIALMLKSCPTYLRDLLFSSLRTLSISPTSENATFLQAKAKLLNISQDHKIRSFHANVVFLDILILLIISLEMSGQQNPHSGDFLSVATLLGMANRLIHFLHLPSLSRERFNSVEDGEHMYRDSRRAWWILVILDTWHAVGTAGSCMIPEYASELHANDDPEILGENLWEMARYTRLTSQLARALAYPTTRDQQMLSHSMLALLKSLHETTSQTVDINLSQIVYNHLKLLLSRLSFLAQPSLPNPSYIYLCDNIIELLKHGQTPYFPLRHHVIALAAKTLMDSTEFLATKGAAMELLSKLVEWLEAEEDEGNRKSQWDSDILMAVRTFVDSRAGNNSLENLANAAVEESGDNDADLDSTTGSSTGIDWGKIVTDGYLGASLTRHG